MNRHVSMKQNIINVLAVTTVSAALLAGTTAFAEATTETETTERSSAAGIETNATELSSEAVIEAERATQADEILRDTIANYTLTIHFPDGTTEVLTADQMGLAYDPENTSRTLPSFSEEALKTSFLALPEASESNVTSAQDAHMSLTSDNDFIIVPETYGTALNMETVLPKLYAAAADWQDLVVLTADDYLQPEVLEDNLDLNAQVRKLNDFLDTTITTELYSGSEVTLDDRTLTNWLSQSEEDPDNWFINTDVIREKAAEWVQFIAAMDDDTDDTCTFHSTLQGDVELTVTSYGHIVDQAAETDELTQMLLTGQSGTYKPIYSTDDTDPTDDDVYVEVDRENQHLWLYKHGVVVMDTDVVTGTDTDPGRRTPAGAFRVFLHQKDRVLTGPGYASPVHYWMPFNGGIGFHDADWRSEFGGSIYLYSGSHGCINMPYDKAGYLYDRISTGTRVFVI